MKITLNVKNKLVIIVFLFLGSACKNDSNKTPVVSEVKKVSLSEIAPKIFPITVTAGGVVAPVEEIKLSFKTGGIIENITTKEGSGVKKGDVLASLNMSEINSHAVQAENAFGKAQRDFNRANNLYKDSVVTLEQVQNAETGLSIARSNYDIAEFNLRHSRIVAPSDGIVLKQLARASELVAPGYPVFIFGSTGKNWRVKAGISDRDVVNISPGDSASVTVDAYPGAEFPGHVNQIGEMANLSTGTYEVEIILEKTGKRMIAGFIASVKIFLSHKEPLLIIPMESLIEAEGKNGYFFTVTGNNIVIKHKIEILSLTDSGAIINNLPPGIDRIVTHGAAYLHDGDSVTIIKEEAKIPEK